MRKYHISYDALDVERDFNNNYTLALNRILRIIARSRPNQIKSYNASSFIIRYPEFIPGLLTYFANNLQNQYRFSASLVGIIGAFDDEIVNSPEPPFRSYDQREILRLAQEEIDGDFIPYARPRNN